MIQSLNHQMKLVISHTIFQMNLLSNCLYFQFRNSIDWPSIVWPSFYDSFLQVHEHAIFNKFLEFLDMRTSEAVYPLLKANSKSINHHSNKTTHRKEVKIFHVANQFRVRSQNMSNLAAYENAQMFNRLRHSLGI